MTLILFAVTVYNIFAGILWGRKARREALAENHARAEKQMSEKQAVDGPFLRPNITDRRSTYAPAPLTAASVSGLEAGTYRPESGYAAPMHTNANGSPIMSENEGLLPPGAAFGSHPQASSSSVVGSESNEGYLSPGQPHMYEARPQSGYSDENRTVVADGSSANGDGSKTGGAGMSRFNPKFWKKGE